MSSTPPPLRTNEADPPPLPPPPRVPGSGYILCDFCGCKLAQNGQIVEMYEKAEGYRDEKENHKKAVGKLDEEITNLRAQITAKDAEIATLKGSTAVRGNQHMF
jgi:hypothetical protein